MSGMCKYLSMPACRMSAFGRMCADISLRIRGRGLHAQYTSVAEDLQKRRPTCTHTLTGWFWRLHIDADRITRIRSYYFYFIFYSYSYGLCRPTSSKQQQS